MKRLSTLCLFLLMVGCSGSDDDDKNDIADTPPTDVCTTDCGTGSDVEEMVELKGVVATGLAVAGAEVVVEDAVGNPFDVSATTDASGNYTVQFEGEVPVPVIIKVVTTDGNELSAIVDDANAEVANVNPITSYVAEALLEDTDLSAITPGEVAQAGQEAVESIFGEGVQYDAFANEEFVAKTAENDTATAASAADVLLDSLAEVAGSQSLDDFIEQSADSETGLMESTAFVVSVATNIALIDGNETEITEVFDLTDASSEVTAQIAVVESFQQIAESIITTVETTEGMTEEESTAAAVGLLEIVSEVVLSDDSADLTVANDIADNVVNNLLDDVVDIVTSEQAEELTGVQLVEAAGNAAQDIVAIIEDEGVDLTTPESDLSAIGDSITVELKLDAQINWDDADWDTLQWQ